MNHLRIYEEFNGDRNELATAIREYLLTEYPSDWWNNEFINRVHDYISEEDIAGYGDVENPETWDYEDEEDAYRNLSTGGAIEYDLMGEIGKDICKKFNLSEDEFYYKLNLSDLVEEHMCNMIDWYDSYLFGENKRQF